MFFYKESLVPLCTVIVAVGGDEFREKKFSLQIDPFIGLEMYPGPDRTGPLLTVIDCIYLLDTHDVELWCEAQATGFKKGYRESVSRFKIPKRHRKALIEELEQMGFIEN